MWQERENQEILRNEKNPHPRGVGLELNQSNNVIGFGKLIEN